MRDILSNLELFTLDLISLLAFNSIFLLKSCCKYDTKPRVHHTSHVQFIIILTGTLSGSI